MDVGLDNINELHITTGNEGLKNIEWLVEANSFEVLELWKQRAQISWVQKTAYHINIADVKIAWEPSESIKLENRKIIGLNETMPVNITFNICCIDGVDVGFYSCDSMVVHYGLVEAWLIKNFRRTHDNYSRWNHCNAMNFSFPQLKTVDKEPRALTHTASNKYQILFGIPEKVSFVKDKNGQIIQAGDCIDIQCLGLHEVFAIDTFLYVKRYEKNVKVFEYFSDDLEIKYKANQKVNG